MTQLTLENEADKSIWRKRFIGQVRNLRKLEKEFSDSPGEIDRSYLTRLFEARIAAGSFILLGYLKKIDSRFYQPMMNVEQRLDGLIKKYYDKKNQTEEAA